MWRRHFLRIPPLGLIVAHEFGHLKLPKKSVDEEEKEADEGDDWVMSEMNRRLADARQH